MITNNFKGVRVSSVRSDKYKIMKKKLRTSMFEPIISNDVSRYKIQDVKKAAESGISDFQRFYAEAYLHGYVVPKDPEKAYELLCKASEGKPSVLCDYINCNGSDRRAIGLKGVCEYYGIGTIQDKSSGISNILKAKGYDDALATLNLGIIYYNDSKYRKAVNLLEKLTQEMLKYRKYVLYEDKISAIAHKVLAQCYIQGIGVRKNSFTAYSHWIIAAEMGDVDSMFNTAICNEFGIGVDKNEKMAFRYLSLAASMNDIEATIKLGDYYSNGIGAKKNLKRAKICYEDALYLSKKG